MKTLFSLGETIVDFLPLDPGAPLSDRQAFIPYAGGAPANVASAFARMGGKAYLLSLLGDDMFGEFLRAAYKKEGIDDSCLLTTDKGMTSLSFVSLSIDGERSFAFVRNPGADSYYEPSLLPLDKFSPGAYLEFSSVSLKSDSMFNAHRLAIEKAIEKKMVIAFDPNLRFSLFPDKTLLFYRINEILPYVDILKLSQDELAFVSDGRSLDTLFRGRLNNILLTDGANGSTLYRKNGERLHVEAVKTKPVDTTGAGDCYFGVFLHECPNLETKDIKDFELPMKRASKAASIVISHKGALPMPSFAEVMAKN